MTDLSDEDINALEVLQEALKLLTLLTRLVQSYLPLISAYTPFLIVIRGQVISLDQKLSLSNRKFRIDIALKKVDK